MRLTSGEVWPIPIYLDCPQTTIEQLAIAVGRRVCLRDPRDDQPISIMTVSDIYRPDKHQEAISVYGADDLAHPGVQYLHTQVHDLYLGGPIQAIQLPAYYDYGSIRCAHIIDNI
jgi:sulfate adenylyltransferase